MKLGIYGDSFADPGSGENDGSWVNYLVNLIEQDSKQSIQVDNYARGGSSLYFSYKKLLATGKKYDLVIFLATEPHRYPNPIMINGRDNYITSIPHVENIERTQLEKLTPETQEIFRNLRGWFLVPNFDFNADMSDLMMSEIEKMHHNMIIYPCFINSFKEERFKKYKLDPKMHFCHSFWFRQAELFDMDIHTNCQEKLTLFGHLTPEFNKYFAKVLFSKYKTGNWDHSGFFDITIDKPKTYYYSNWDNV